MEKRSLFSRIFGTDKSSVVPQTATEVKVLDDQKATFTPYKGDFHDDIDIRACVDAIARNGAKMHPRHIRNYDGKMENLKSNLYKLLSKQPNEIQDAYKFYYQVITNLELYNDSFVYIQRDSDLNITGLYPLDFSEGKLYEFEGKLWIKFRFGRSKERFVPYDSCIHLTRFVGKDGLFGGSTIPIIKTLSIKHIIDEGIVNAIKTTQRIKGIVKTTKSMLKPEDVKKMRDQFVDDFIKGGDRIGIGGLDATTDFTPVKIEPTTASENQIKIFDDKILAYFGVNENIIQSKYNEDEWNAFYENTLEPIALQLSLEFSKKLFSDREVGHGNLITFEANRLQYASNSTKVAVARLLTDIGAASLDQILEIFNMAPIGGEEGSRRVQTLNMVNANKADEYQVGKGGEDDNTEED